PQGRPRRRLARHPGQGRRDARYPGQGRRDARYPGQGRRDARYPGRDPERGRGRRPCPGQGRHPAQAAGRPLLAAGERRPAGGGPALMMAYLIPLALRNRWLVLALALAIAGFGVWTFQHQKIEAYPDISGQMVQVITTYPGRAPEEVERQVTIPIEQAMGNVPRVEVIRSRTIFGLSVVQLSFEEGVETYLARHPL